MPPSSNDFRRVLAGEGISNFGSTLGRLALPWPAMFALALVVAIFAVAAQVAHHRLRDRR